MLLAGHTVKLVCLPSEAEVINKEGIRVRLPIKGRDAVEIDSRSLPEIGRRFGNRDHTTVLHAIRKIQGCVEADVQLKDEIDDLKKQLAPESGVVR